MHARTSLPLIKTLLCLSWLVIAGSRSDAAFLSYETNLNVGMGTDRRIGAIALSPNDHELYVAFWQEANSQVLW